MDKTFNGLRINADRLKENFNQISEFGKTSGGGVHRPTFSTSHLEARAWLKQNVINSGLIFKIDSAGNHSAILPTTSRIPKNILIGSHLDSVPDGGRFDGALGVIAALEVLQTIQDARIDLDVNLEAIDFTDEEGTLVGLLGSSALTGKIAKSELSNPRGGRDPFLKGLNAAGLSIEGMLNAFRKPELIIGYLELHIEQGARLVNANADIGIVSSIAGISSNEIIFVGESSHAGTTSMHERLDASLGASAFTLKAREIILSSFPNCVVNIGNMHFNPGAFNIIPGEVRLAMEFRAPDIDLLDQLDKHLHSSAKKAAKDYGLSLKTTYLGKHPPALMSNSVISAIKHSCDSLNLTSMELVSGAGHDAQSFDGFTEVGMLFIPSVDGISHSPKEYSTWHDCINGVNVLLQTTLNLTRQFSSKQTIFDAT